MRAAHFIPLYSETFAPPQVCRSNRKEFYHNFTAALCDGDLVPSWRSWLEDTNLLWDEVSCTWRVVCMCELKVIGRLVLKQVRSGTSFRRTTPLGRLSFWWKGSQDGCNQSEEIDCMECNFVQLNVVNFANNDDAFRVEDNELMLKFIFRTSSDS